MKMFKFLIERAVLSYNCVDCFSSRESLCCERHRHHTFLTRIKTENVRFSNSCVF